MPASGRLPAPGIGQDCCDEREHQSPFDEDGPDRRTLAQDELPRRPPGAEREIFPEVTRESGRRAAHLLHIGQRDEGPLPGPGDPVGERERDEPDGQSGAARNEPRASPAAAFGGQGQRQREEEDDRRKFLEDRDAGQQSQKESVAGTGFLRRPDPDRAKEDADRQRESDRSVIVADEQEDRRV